MTKEQFNFIKRFSKFDLCLFASPDVIDFIACVFALESNFGTSVLAKRYNNYCAMKVPYERFGFFDVDDIGLPCSYIGFATYENFELCYMDFIVWLGYMRFDQKAMNDLNVFVVQFANSGYSPVKGYIDKINLIYSQFKTFNNVTKN